jgi:hypothetical protein
LEMEDVMATCEYSTSCCLLSKELANMPMTSEYIRANFCYGKFTACVRFNCSKSVGIDNVPVNLPTVSFKSPKCFCRM